MTKYERPTAERRRAAAKAPAWTTPLPLGEAVQRPFPIGALPPLLRTAVEHVATTRAVHPVLPFTGYMGGISGVFAEGLRVVITPSWVESVNLYLFAVAVSGDGKSPALKPALAMVEAIEVERCAQVADETIVAKARLVMLPDEIKAARKSGDLGLVRSLVTQQEEAKETLRHSGRLTVQDATPEATSLLMGRNGGLLVVIDAEGSIIHHALGMYSDNPNIGLWLAGWSGEMYQRDRVREEGAGEVVVSSARIGIGATIQPGVLRALLRDPSVHDRGFLSRALCAWPPSSAGGRWLDAIEAHPRDDRFLDPLHERVLECWKQYRAAPTSFVLGTAARREFIEWHDAQEALMTATDESGQQFIPKVRASVARMAACFHALSEDDAVIGPRTMRDAITVGSWYLDGREVSAEQALLGDARKVLAWLQGREVATAATTVRAANHGVQWHRYEGGTERTISALVVLAEHGWIAPADDREGFGTAARRVRKSSPGVLVNPAVDGTDGPDGTGGRASVGERSAASLHRHEGGRAIGAIGAIREERRKPSKRVGRIVPDHE